jgi:beta-lactamase regulating signal transducer with metallopeptidase domain
MAMIPAMLIIVWLAGVVVLLVRRCVLIVRLELRLRGLQCTGALQGDVANNHETDNSVNHDTSRQWKNLLAQFGIAPERIPVLWTDDTGPALVRSLTGYRLLFPQLLWDELSPEHREGVLRHELSHYLSGDVWTSELARLLATLQWFNPIAWVALRKLEEATEWRCDDFAVAAGKKVIKSVDKT